MGKGIKKDIKKQKKQEQQEKHEKKKDKKEIKREARKSSADLDHKKLDSKHSHLLKENESLKNQLRAREDKFRLFESLLTGLDSVTHIFSGLSEAQQQRLASKGFDLESGQRQLKDLLFRDADEYVEDLKAKVKEEFVMNQKELERERDLLGDSISNQRNTMNELGLLDEADVDKSLAPLQSKLKSKLEELQRNEATIKALSSEIPEIQES